MTFVTKNGRGTNGQRGADPHRVRPSAIRQVAREIAERFQPEKIILFGSYAYGEPHADSDIDLLVVMPARNEIAQAARIWNTIEPPFPLDLIVRTPHNLKWRLEEGDWFLREAVGKGKVLYAGASPNSSPSANPQGVLRFPLPDEKGLGSYRFSLGPPVKKLTREWVRKAEEDWALAGQANKVRPQLLDGFCFHCQQTVEKYFKALLQEFGASPPRPHDLNVLLDRLLRHDPDLKPLRPGLKSLTAFAVDYRYPGFHATSREAQAALRRTERVRLEIRARLGIPAKTRQRKQTP